MDDEALDEQRRNGSEVLDVAGEHGQGVFESGGGDEGIAHLRAVAERHCLLASFKAHGIKSVLIAYDRDEAGDRAAEKLSARFIAEGFEVLRVVFPQGMDANEYARKFASASQVLALVLRQAQWLGGAAKSAAERNPTPPAEGVGRRGRCARSFFSR